jgi:ketosteroid isomerase-like protein
MNMPKQLLVSSALGAAFLGFMSLQLSCAHERTRAERETVTAMLKQQADRWDQDIIKKDLPAIAKNMSEDFRHISNKGAISNKETFLQEIVSPDLVIHPYTVEDFDIRIYGNCALLCGRTKMTGSYKGNPFQSHYRYVDTYTLSNGQWKVCNVQITSIPE